MKVLKSQYFACGSQGYIKIKDIDIKQCLNKKQLSISSRCNQILPISESRFQQEIQEETPLTKQQIKSQIKINVQESLNLFQQQKINPEKIMQKQEVYSIHMDDIKSTSKKNFNSAKDLTFSTFTNLNKNKDQMKRSMNFFQRSTAPSVQQNQNNYRLNQFQNELTTQKNHRKKLQQKYNILINFVQTNQKMKTQRSYVQEDQFSQKLENSLYKRDKKQTKKQKKTKAKVNKNYDEFSAKLDTQGSQQADNDNLIALQSRNCATSRQNNKSNPQLQCQSCKVLKIDQYSPQIYSQFEQMKQKIDLLTDHIENLQQRIEQDERKNQLQLLHRDLKQKQKQIQIMQNQNNRMKQMNDLMIIKEIKIQKNQGHSAIHKAFAANPIVISFCMTLLILLVFSNLKNSMC